MHGKPDDLTDLQKMIAAAKAKGWTQDAIDNWIRRSLGIKWFTNLDLKTPWTMFATMTFRPESKVPRHHALTAGRRFRSWLSGWRGIWGPTHRLVLWSAEEHKSGCVHLHALWAHYQGQSKPHCDRCLASLNQPGEPDWRVFKDSWFIHWGIGRFFPFDKSKRFGAEQYVVKYVMDESCLDWGIECGV